MELTITSQNVELTPEMMEQVNDNFSQKIARLLKNFSDDVKNAAITIEQHPSRGFIVRFNMNLPKNKKIYAKTQNPTFTTALTDLRSKVRRQVKTYKRKLYSTNGK